MKIICEQISKSYSNTGRKVIDGLSMEIASGESLAISGPSGAGKSTLLNLLSGLDNPDKGNIYFDDICFSKLTDSKKILFRLKNISIIFQSPNLLNDFNVIENIMLPIRYIGSSYKASKDIALQCLDSVDLVDFANEPISTLSGGESQRVGIARALAMKSKIIFADEPTGNLDTKITESVINSLIDICNKKMITLITVSHDESVISKMSVQKKIINGKLFSI